MKRPAPKKCLSCMKRNGIVQCKKVLIGQWDKCTGINENGLSGVYLLHYDRSMTKKNGWSQKHYIGYSRDVQRRVISHYFGHGSVMTREEIEAGGNLWIAKIWWARGIDFETELKKLEAGIEKICPICKAQWGGYEI